MPVKTRSTNGRFEAGPSASYKKDDEETTIALQVNKESVWGFLKLFILILLISPWFFIALKKKNTLENVSKTISEFYDDNFSCNSQCICDAKSTNVNSTNAKQGINNF